MASWIIVATIGVSIKATINKTKNIGLELFLSSSLPPRCHQVRAHALDRVAVFVAAEDRAVSRVGFVEGEQVGLDAVGLVGIV